MSYLPPVVAELRADIHQFSAKMGEAKMEMSGLDGAAAKSHAAVKGMAVGVAVAGIAIAAHSVKLASDFQSNMAMIHTQAMAFGEDIGKMSDAVLTMAGQVGQSPIELAKGLYHIESAGFRGAQALDMLKLSAEGAAVGHANLEDVTQSVIGMMAAHIKGVNNATDAMGWLNATVGTGDMRMQDMAQSLQNGIIPVFANAGLGAKDFAAALATITDNATKPQVATTHLLHTVAMMEAPTHKAIGALQSMGMTQFQLANDMRGPGGLGAAVHDLNEHLHKLSPNDQNKALSAIFGGGKSFGTMQELSRELERLDSKYKVGGTAVKDFAKSWSETQHTFKQTNDQFKASLESGMIRVGNLLLPILTSIEQAVMAIGRWISNHKEAWAAFAGVAAALGVALAEMAASALMVAAPFILIAAAAAAIGLGLYELYQHSKPVRDAVQKIGDVVQHVFQEMHKWLLYGQIWWIEHKREIEATIKQIVDTIVQVIGDVVKWLGDQWHAVLKFANEWWHDHGRQVKEAAHAIWAGIQSTFHTIVKIFEFAWPYISTIVQTAWNLIRDYVSTGIKVASDIIGGFIDFFTGNWGKLWGDAKQLLSDVFSGIGKLLGDWASGAGDLLVQAGKDLLHGLIKGIKSMFGGVKDSLGSLTNSLTSWKGPPEKDRMLLFESGQMVIGGFRAGLESQYGAVHGSLQAFTAGLHTGLVKPSVAHKAYMPSVPSSAAYGLGISGALVHGMSLTAMAPKHFAALQASHQAPAHAAVTTHAATGHPAHHPKHHTKHHTKHHHSKHHSKHHSGGSHHYEYVFDITLMVDGEKLWRVMQKETLKHERHNGHNGLSVTHK